MSDGPKEAGDAARSPHEIAPEHQVRYGEAIRTIEQQFASVGAAQTRAGLILAALTISAAELGRRAVDRPGEPLPLAGLLAWVALVVCGASTLYAMWPRNLRGTFLVDDLPDLPADHLVQTIVHNLASLSAENERTIKWIWRSLKVALCALVINAAGWGSIVIWR